VHRAKSQARKQSKQEAGDKGKGQDEGHEGESLRERKMREAKERQKAIMAKFAVQQKKVMAQFEKDGEKEDKGKEKDKGDVAASTDEATEGGDVCVFCREGDSDENPLCMMAFTQRTNRLAHAKRQSERVWKTELRKRFFGATDDEATKLKSTSGSSSGSGTSKRETKDVDDFNAKKDALDEVLESMEVEDEDEDCV
jgi:ribosomal protein L28